MRNPCPDSVTFVTSTLTPVMEAGTDAAGDMAVAVATKTKQHITVMDSARSSRLFSSTASNGNKNVTETEAGFRSVHAE